MTTQEMIEVMRASLDGKKIEYSPAERQDVWNPVGIPSWNWDKYNYRIAPEPKKSEGRWERVEIEETPDGYVVNLSDGKTFSSQASSIPGFGGIEYRSPFDAKVTVRSMVPLMFESKYSNDYVTAGDYSDGDVMNFHQEDRPGIPVAAWFWREGE